MADFGKLNFAVAFNPQSAFPLDARCYFESLEAAQAAAATAEAVGSTNTVYYFGQMVMVDDGESVKWYMIQRPGTLVEIGSGGSSGSSGDGSGCDCDDSVTLLVDGLNYHIDNGLNLEPTEDEDTYALEIF